MKKNKNTPFVTFIGIEIVLIIVATLALQFFLFASNKRLKYANLKLQTDIQQISSLSFVEQDLIKEKLISKEIASYPTGENSVNDFVAKLQGIAQSSNCELYQVSVQSIVPVDITNKDNDKNGTVTANNINFSLAAINVQVKANYSELIKFISLVRNMNEIAGISANNFEIPLDSKNSKENFVSLPLFFIFKSN